MRLMSKGKFPLLNLLIVIMMLAVCMAFAADPAKWREGLAEDGSERRTGVRYPMPVQESPFEKIIATGSQTVGTSAAVLLATPNALTKKVTVGALNGAFNWGPATIPGDELYPFYVASGSTKTFLLATTTPKIYFRGRTATGTLDRIEE